MIDWFTVSQDWNWLQIGMYGFTCIAVSDVSRWWRGRRSVTDRQ